MTFRRIIAVFVLASVSVRCTEAIADPNPGLQTRISQHGLDYVTSTAVKKYRHFLRHLSIDDTSGRAGTPVGDVNYDLQQMAIQDADIPNFSIKPQPNVGLKVSLWGASAKVKGDWKYSYKLVFIDIKDSGSFDVQAKGLSLDVVARLGKDKDGKPTISAVSCNAHINDLRVKFNGGASWLYNLFADNIADGMKGDLSNQLCQGATDGINNDLADTFSDIKVVTSFGGDLDFMVIDYRLVEPPKFTDKYLETAHKGEIYQRSQHKAPPFSPKAMPEQKETSRMVYLWVSDYVANTLLYTLQNSGFLNKFAQQIDLPKDSKFALNTSYFAIFVKEIHDKYNNLAMTMTMNSTMAPKLTITEGNITVDTGGVVSFSALPPNQNPVHLFNFRINMTVVLAPKLVDLSIVGNVTIKRFDVSVENSDVGQISLFFVQLATDTMLTNTVIPWINAQVAQGLPLPKVDRLKFVKPELKLTDGCMVIATDLEYTLSDK
ncbi:bactericidal permeability-increasing protein-like [Ptychodera flava]|uniref:bactericidal permeability-increasing protein-like n=1 Tax=Ptychodera flava TaxID=63121 RepID=UPI00396A0053